MDIDLTQCMLYTFLAIPLFVVIGRWLRPQVPPRRLDTSSKDLLCNISGDDIEAACVDICMAMNDAPIFSDEAQVVS